MKFGDTTLNDNSPISLELKAHAIRYRIGIENKKLQTTVPSYQWTLSSRNCIMSFIMKNSPRIIFAFIILLLSVLACNVPAPEQVLPPSDVQTSAALTIQAILTPTITSTPQQVIPTDTPTATSAPTGTITPTYSIPILTIREQTNCRTGPGQDYEVIFTYLPKKKLEILGRYDPGNFWLVKSSESPTGQCWLWGEYVDVAGSYWVVSSVTPPPTSTKAPPAAPSIQKWDFFCSTASGEMEMTILWTDRASDETGYRVIRNEQAVAELPPNSEKYTETILLGAGESVTYYIEVYNAAGSVRSSPIKLTC